MIESSCCIAARLRNHSTLSSDLADWMSLDDAHVTALATIKDILLVGCENCRALSVEALSASLHRPLTYQEALTYITQRAQ